MNSDITEYLLEGIREFNSGNFFEAHENWEKLWRSLADSDEKKYLQGMIKIAAALHHYKRAEYAGTVKLLSRGLDLLKAFGNARIAIDKTGFLKEVTTIYRQFTAASPPQKLIFPKIKVP